MWLTVVPGRRHGQWPLLRERTLSASELEVLNQVPSRSAHAPRYAAGFSLQIGVEVAVATVTLPQEKKAQLAGCRILGDVLDALLSLYHREVLPQTVIINMDPGFQVRGLLTLSYLSTSEARKAVMGGYSRELEPALPGERDTDYESRVVAQFEARHPELEALETTQLCLPRIARSKPDGLYYHQQDRVLTILEAKMRGVGFAEGGSQVVQYFAQARNIPRFEGFRIRSVLITSDSTESPSYARWQRFMDSPKDVEFVIRADSVPSKIEAPWI
jgi:hypothetical protein